MTLLSSCVVNPIFSQHILFCISSIFPYPYRFACYVISCQLSADRCKRTALLTCTTCDDTLIKKGSGLSKCGNFFLKSAFFKYNWSKIFVVQLSSNTIVLLKIYINSTLYLFLPKKNFTSYFNKPIRSLD